MEIHLLRVIQHLPRFILSSISRNSLRSQISGGILFISFIFLIALQSSSWKKPPMTPRYKVRNSLQAYPGIIRNILKSHRPYRPLIKPRIPSVMLAAGIFYKYSCFSHLTLSFKNTLCISLNQGTHVIQPQIFGCPEIPGFGHIIFEFLFHRCQIIPLFRCSYLLAWSPV